MRNVSIVTLSFYKKGVRPPVPTEDEEAAVRAVEAAECCSEVIGNMSDDGGEDPDMEDTGVRNEPPPPVKLPRHRYPDDDDISRGLMTLT